MQSCIIEHMILPMHPSRCSFILGICNAWFWRSHVTFVQIVIARSLSKTFDPHTMRNHHVISQNIAVIWNTNYVKLIIASFISFIDFGILLIKTHLKPHFKSNFNPNFLFRPFNIINPILQKRKHFKMAWKLCEIRQFMSKTL